MDQLVWFFQNLTKFQFRIHKDQKRLKPWHIQEIKCVWCMESYTTRSLVWIPAAASSTVSLFGITRHPTHAVCLHTPHIHLIFSYGDNPPINDNSQGPQVLSDWKTLCQKPHHGIFFHCQTPSYFYHFNIIIMPECIVLVRVPCIIRQTPVRTMWVVGGAGIHFDIFITSAIAF